MNWAGGSSPPVLVMGGQPQPRPEGIVKKQGSLTNWAQQQVTANKRCEGALKNFNADKGYGFIASTCVEGDIFIHRSELPDGEPQVGRALEFDLMYQEQKPQARNVVWAAEKRFIGYVKSLGDEYGFITCDESHRMYGRDVYVTRSQLPTLDQKKKLSFAILVNSKGQPQAADVLCEEESVSQEPESVDSEVQGSRIQRW